MPNVMAAQQNIGGALYESSVTPFPCTTPQSLTAICCWSAVQRRCQYENARLGRKVNFAAAKIPSGGKSRQKCIYCVPAQETAKYRAKFGWLPLSDVVAVTKPRRETR